MKRLSTQSAVYLSLAVTCQLLLFYILKPLPEHLNVLQVQFTWSPEKFNNILQSWSVGQRQIFLSHYWVDFLYPLFYAMFFYSFLRESNVSRRVAQMFAAAGVFDLAENGFHLALIGGWLPITALSVPVAALLALVKWLLVSGFFIFSLGLLIFQRRQGLEK